MMLSVQFYSSRWFPVLLLVVLGITPARADLQDLIEQFRTFEETSRSESDTVPKTELEDWIIRLDTAIRRNPNDPFWSSAHSLAARLENTLGLHKEAATRYMAIILNTDALIQERIRAIDACGKSLVAGENDPDEILSVYDMMPDMVEEMEMSGIPVDDDISWNLFQLDKIRGTVLADYCTRQVGEGKHRQSSEILQDLFQKTEQVLQYYDLFREALCDENRRPAFVPTSSARAYLIETTYHMEEVCKVMNRGFINAGDDVKAGDLYLLLLELMISFPTNCEMKAPPEVSDRIADTIQATYDVTGDLKSYLQNAERALKASDPAHGLLTGMNGFVAERLEAGADPHLLMQISRLGARYQKEYFPGEYSGHTNYQWSLASALRSATRANAYAEAVEISKELAQVTPAGEGMEQIINAATAEFQRVDQLISQAVPSSLELPIKPSQLALEETKAGVETGRIHPPEKEGKSTSEDLPQEVNQSLLKENKPNSIPIPLAVILGLGVGVMATWIFMSSRSKRSGSN